MLKNYKCSGKSVEILKNYHVSQIFRDLCFMSVFICVMLKMLKFLLICNSLIHAQFIIYPWMVPSARITNFRRQLDAIYENKLQLIN